MRSICNFWGRNYENSGKLPNDRAASARRWPACRTGKGGSPLNIEWVGSQFRPSRPLARQHIDRPASVSAGVLKTNELTGHWIRALVVMAYLTATVSSTALIHPRFRGRQGWR